MRMAPSEMAVERTLTDSPLQRELMGDARFFTGGPNMHFLKQKPANG